MGGVNGGGPGGREAVSCKRQRPLPASSQELAMADVAFVVVTLAVFALMALAVKGVTRL